MKKLVDRVAVQSDGVTLCLPGEGYSRRAVVELDEYEEIGMARQLPPFQEAWPKGDPHLNHYIKDGHRILKRRLHCKVSQ